LESQVNIGKNKSGNLGKEGSKIKSADSTKKKKRERFYMAGEEKGDWTWGKEDLEFDRQGRNQ